MQSCQNPFHSFENFPQGGYTRTYTQSIVNRLYQIRGQAVRNASRNEGINLTVTNKGTDKDHGSFNFSSTPWKYFILLTGHTKREKRWHLTPQLVIISIHTNPHACLQSCCLCVQEQSWLAYQVRLKCFGCTFNKTSYEIP